MQPPPDRTPSQWADEKRVLPLGSAEPGPYRSSRTPYCIPIGNVCVNPKIRRVGAIMGSQMGKTAGLQNIVGQKFDDDPQPVLWVGPTKSNVSTVIAPQIRKMFSAVPSLAEKIAPGKRKALAWEIAGVMLRFAWAGSTTEMASDSAHTVLMDEVDRMKALPKEGDPVALGDARRATYQDGRSIYTSTPTDGTVETEKDEHGIEHWKLAESDDIASNIWALYQEGTRYEWAVPCPTCAQFFIPRFRLLWWPEGSSPQQALRGALLTCQRCGDQIGNEHKDWMNACGTYLAPGQNVEGWDRETREPPAHAWLDVKSDNGAVVGDPGESDTVCLWVSGLMSPFVSFGQRAAAYLRAVKSSDPEKIRAVINTGFGELYAVRGSAPQWEALRDMLATPYVLRDVPRGVQKLFLTVDVQKDHLVCNVVGWGADWESWRIFRTELWGSTDEPEVWEKLTQLKGQTFGGMPISAVAVDAGYRQERVLEWVHGAGFSCYATKGAAKPTKLYHRVAVEVNRGGKVARRGLHLWMLDASYLKGWVHDRFNWPQDQAGAFHIPGPDRSGEWPDGTEDYVRQLVGEARMKTPSGRTMWVRTGPNHFLDTEGLQVFLAHVERVRDLQPLPDDVVAAPPVSPVQTIARRKGKYLQ